jgi:hypothetical protein
MKDTPISILEAQVKVYKEWLDINPYHEHTPAIRAKLWEFLEAIEKLKT